MAGMIIRLEILRCSYWERFKFFNDKSLGSHVMQNAVDGEIGKIVDEMDRLKTKIEDVKARKGNKV